MSTGQEPSEQRGAPPSEEELRAAYEAEIKRLRVEHLLLEQVVSLVNLGMRRTGLAPGTEGERDPEQVSLAIESIRAVLPLIDQAAPEQAKPIRDALSQLQLAFVRIGGKAEPEAAPGPKGEAAAAEEKPPEPGQPGPAQRSGKLWIPGQ